MKVIIRNKISDTYEEIYGFEVTNYAINYDSIHFSRRNSKNDVWGYDWEEYYGPHRDREIRSLGEIDPDDYNMLYEYEDIKDKYNPVMNKTDDGYPLLKGCYGGNMLKDHPPKMTESEVKEFIKKEFLLTLEKLSIK